MKVKEWISELELYDDDAEVVFEIQDDIKCESWTEDRFGYKSVYLDCELKETFVCEISGDCRIELGVKDE